MNPRVEIYTDGACRENPKGAGGYGVVLHYYDANNQLHKKELSQGYKNTTNNRMELRGVIEGLKALTKPCSIKIYSDSQYIVNAFNQKWLVNWQKNNWRRGPKKEPVKNVDLWQELLPLVDYHQVEFIWVRGHDGHAENERCDVLATQAADGGPWIIDTVEE